MKKIKLTLDRSYCIDCVSCIPEAWDAFTNTYYLEKNKDNEVHLSSHSEIVDEREEWVLEVTDPQLQSIHNAATICPVDAIAVEEITD